MPVAARPGGIALLFAGLLPAPPGSAAQDTVNRAELARCAAVDDRSEKLACFEALAAPADSARARPAAAQERSAASEDRTDRETSTDPVTANAAGPSAAAAADPPPDPPPDAPPAAAAEPVRRASDRLGAEHLPPADSPRQEPEYATATVEEVWKEGNRLLYFRFDNGQVWRQMESGYFHFPRDGGFEVTIRQGFMGDYQMRVAGRARMTRIVRVQ